MEMCTRDEKRSGNGLAALSDLCGRRAKLGGLGALAKRSLLGGGEDRSLLILR
jgi:hypothetical protein